MPLTIIKGPPNSGRTDELERRYLESISRRPVLVVPGVDDIFDWERRLTRGSGAMVGGQIVHFRDLFAEILRNAGSSRMEAATELQRLGFVRRAIVETENDLEEMLPDQPGLAKAVLDLIDSFQTEMLDPDTIVAKAEEAGLRGLAQYARIYQHYLGSLKEANLTDGPGEASAAIAIVNQTWQNRPVMFAGFDEMTGQQREIVRRLAFECGVEVVVAVTFEPDNPAMNLTATLVSQLEHLGPENLISGIETRRPDDLPHAGLLLRLQHDFLKDGCRGTVDAREDWTAFTVLESAGQRNEAEAIGGEIAKLIADQDPEYPVGPGDIAIAVEAPSTQGIVIRDVLEDFAIPVALEGETPAHATVTGKAVLQLLAASRPAGTARELIAFLRAPGGPDPDSVDRFELNCRLDDVGMATDAIRRFGKGVDLPGSIRDLLDGAEPTEVVSNAARTIARAILAADPTPVPSAATAIEVRTAEAIANACAEIREIEAEASRSQAITDALQSGLVKVWAVPDQGTVRIASPYSLRAKRFKYLFYAGLQEAPIADTDRISPFMSAGDLQTLNMSPRRDPEDQQRYLFYSCLTVPTDGLCLSCRVSDETGSPEHPSPLIGVVASLFTTEDDEEGKPVPVYRRGGKLGSDSVFQPDHAPTEAELARSLRGNRIAETAIPGIGDEVAVKIDAKMGEAVRAASRNSGFGDLTEAVTSHWRNTPTFGATELEAFSCCPYQWFVERQINPQTFGPEPDYFAFGNLVHGVLEHLYAADPGKMPRDGEVPDGWLEELPGLVQEISKQKGIRLDSNSISHAAQRKMAELRIRQYLLRQRNTVPYFVPELIEAQFGTSRAEIDAVDMGGWKLKGKIDRVDLSRELEGIDEHGQAFKYREALVIDYKTGEVSSKYSPQNVAKERKFQIQLYMEALTRLGEELGLGRIRPVAGMYVPVRLAREMSRGAALSDQKLKPGQSEMADDLLSRGMGAGEVVPSIDDYLAEGGELARGAVAEIAEGRLDHVAATCPHHFESPVVRTRATEEDEQPWR